jgi:branched-chain amino acid transport system permease protein
VAVLALYPSVAEQGYLTYTLIVILAYSIIGLYYNMLLGHLGIPFLGPMVPYAIGGFTAAYLSLNGYNPLVGILIGCFFAAGSGFAFSLLSMRLRGLYMALYSLVFTLFFANLIVRSDIPAVFNIFVGAIGQHNIPDVTLGGFPWRLRDGVAYYYLAILLFVGSAIFLKKLLDSRFGVAFKGVRDAEVYAASLGIGIFRVKVIAFATSSFFIGLWRLPDDLLPGDWARCTGHEQHASFLLHGRLWRPRHVLRSGGRSVHPSSPEQLSHRLRRLEAFRVGGGHPASRPIHPRRSCW